MKRILMAIAVLVALIAPSSALAQPQCWPSLTFPTIWRTADSTSRVREREIVYAASSVGLVWGYGCTGIDGKLYHYIAGGPWSAFPPDWLAIADTLARGTDGERAAAWVKYATGTAIDPRLEPDVKAVSARLPLPPPAPVPGGWVVAPTAICSSADKDLSGKCVRRAAYLWAGGVRGPVSGTANIGSACDLTVGAAGFYGVNGRTDRVAPCVKQ
jgi:hypothetical protein